MLSARRLQRLLLAVTLLFAAAVGWLGWKLIEQDRALAKQRRIEQLQAAASRVSGALFRRLTELEELATGGTLPPGALRLGNSELGLIATPSALLYYPTAPHTPILGTTVFSRSEELEFRLNDPSGAAESLRGLTEAGDPNVRATALARLGRNLRKASRTTDALEAYARLSAMKNVYVDGLPAELVALEARSTIFEQLGRREELRREARLMGERLLSGNWRLTQAAWESQRDQVTRWHGKLTVDAEQLALSDAAQIVWRRGGRGREMLGESPRVVGVWNSNVGNFNGVIAPIRILEAALAEAAPFHSTLADFEPRQPDAKLWVELSPAATKLPWTVVVASKDDAAGAFEGRTWIFAIGFVLLVSLLAVAGLVLSRAVAREMAVARLQADFVAAVSHEFRSPLSSISQISELLTEDRFPTPEHRRKGYAVLSRESARLKKLVETLLDFAQMEAGSVAYRLERSDVEEVVRAVVEEFGGVELEVDAELPAVELDREALRTALWNLLENAVKYSTSEVRVRVEVMRDGARVAIRVSDSGIGIPTEEQQFVFQKFYRAGEAKERRVKGTGIGLSMVKHIVEGHGGEMRLESQPGQGSTFTMLLPERRQG